MTEAVGRWIARESIPGVAAAMEQRHKSFAGVYAFVCVLVAVACAAMAIEPRHNDFDGPSTAIAGGLVWFLPFAFAVRRRVRKARGAKAAAAAANDASIQWDLVGDRLIPSRDGAVQTDAFEITRTLRATLLAVPRATVVEK